MEVDGSDIYYDYSLLPPHVITSILLCLKAVDLKRALQTCSTWYDASIHPYFHQRMQIRFDHITFDATNQQQFATILNTPRLFSKIIFNYVKFEEPFFDSFWSRFGAIIKEIEFNNCKLSRKMLIKMLSLLSNLESFKFEVPNFDPIFADNYYSNEPESGEEMETPEDHNNYEQCMTNIANLKRISFKGPCCSEFFNRLLGNLTKLEHFHYNDFPDGRNSFSMDQIIQVLKMNKKTIESLHLNMSTYSVQQLSDFLKKIKLKTLKFENRNSEAISLHDVALSRDTAEHIYLSPINDEQLCSICAQFPNLKVLEMKAFRGEHIMCINNLKFLEVLKFYNTCFNANHNVENLFVDKKPHLRVLTIHDLITSTVLIKITETCPNLEELCLGNVKGESARDLQTIFKNLTNLKKLIIMYAFFNTEDNLYDGDEYTVSNLRKLRCFKLMGSVVGDRLSTLDRLKRLTNLEVLYISNLTGGTRDDIIELVKNCRCLEELSLYNVSAFDDELIPFIRQNLLNLRTLNFDACKNVSHKNNTVFTERNLSRISQSKISHGRSKKKIDACCSTI